MIFEERVHEGSVDCTEPSTEGTPKHKDCCQATEHDEKSGRPPPRV